MNLEVNVQEPIAKSAAEIFAAIVDPEKMSGYFISGASGPLEAGAAVEWRFDDVGMKIPVAVREVVPDRLIAFDWPASGVDARVTIRLEARNEDTTLVSINETGWPLDREGVPCALGQTRGWTDFLCCLKAYLQYGINLRQGRGAADH